MKAVVIDGGLSDASFSKKIAKKVATRLFDSSYMESSINLAGTIIESLEHHSPHVCFEVEDKISEADVVVVVSPVHNKGMSAIMKLLLDYLDRDILRGKPAIAIGCGGSIRDTMVVDTAIKPVLSAIGFVPVPTSMFLTENEDTADFDLRLAQAYKEVKRMNNVR